MKIDEVFQLANELKFIHRELDNWTIRFHNKKNSFGTCSYRKREILLSKSLLPFMSDYGIKMTILHEIAHALTPRHSHDYVWRRKCIEIGGNGERLGDDKYYINGKDGKVEHKLTTSKYTLTCPECGFQTYKNRKPKYSISCGKHGRIYNPKYKMILTEN